VEQEIDIELRDIVRERIVVFNEIAQSIFTNFNATSESWEEAQRLCLAFNDGEADIKALVSLQAVMVQIANFSLTFAISHMESIVSLKRLEAILSNATNTDAASELPLEKLQSLTQTYENFERSLTPLMNQFRESASYFVFPPTYERQ